MFKTIAFGVLVLPKRVTVVESRRKESVYKRSWFGWMYARKISTPSMVYEEGTLDHDRGITKVFPVTLKYGNKVFSKLLNIPTRWTKVPYLRSYSKIVPQPFSVVRRERSVALESSRFESLRLLHRRRTS